MKVKTVGELSDLDDCIIAFLLDNEFFELSTPAKTSSDQFEGLTENEILNATELANFDDDVISSRLVHLCASELIKKTGNSEGIKYKATP